MELKELYRLADEIPSMGGTEIGPVLRDYARKAPDKTAVVEVGCWLGAGTAQLALGIRERTNGANLRIYCYDRWTANEAEIEKAASRGLQLQPGEDLLPHAQRMLQPFDVPIEFHQGDLRAAQWNGDPISVYVDDASKTPKLFFHSLRTFGPSWKPGETIVFLMDYDIWKKTGNKDHQCQKEFIEAHPDSFERIPHPEVAMFRYRRPVDFESWTAPKLGFAERDEIERLARQLAEKDSAIVLKMTRLVSIQETEIKARQAEIKAQQAQIKKLTKTIQARDSQLESIKNSSSWRVTALLRGLADAVRSVTGRGQRRPPSEG